MSIEGLINGDALFEVELERRIKMTSNSFTGGCQCGAIRFRTSELFDNAHICHCRMCQKAVGNYFAALVSSPKAKLLWTRGTPSRFLSSADVERGFCSQCGTPLFYDAVHSPDIGMMIGAFDQPAAITLVSQDSIESRVPWFNEITDVPDSGTSEDLDGPERVWAVAASNRQHPDHDTEKWPK
jgi:hypothetical protein